MTLFEIISIVSHVIIWVCIVVDGALMIRYVRLNKSLRLKLKLMDDCLVEMEKARDRWLEKVRVLPDEGENNN